MPLIQQPSLRRGRGTHRAEGSTVRDGPGGQEASSRIWSERRPGAATGAPPSSGTAALDRNPGRSRTPRPSADRHGRMRAGGDGGSGRQAGETEWLGEGRPHHAVRRRPGRRSPASPNRWPGTDVHPQSSPGSSPTTRSRYPRADSSATLRRKGPLRPAVLHVLAARAQVSPVEFGGDRPDRPPARNRLLAAASVDRGRDLRARPRSWSGRGGGTPSTVAPASLAGLPSRRGRSHRSRDRRPALPRPGVGA